MSRPKPGFVAVLVLAWPGGVLAQTPSAPTPAPAPPPASAPSDPAQAAPVPGPAPAAASVAAPPSAAPVAKAPKKGVLGVGPFWAAIDQGDAAYVARDFEGAVRAYREAIEKEPQNPMGHYRLGQAQLTKGDRVEAEQSWQAGLRFAGNNANLRAKLLFVLADLAERQRNHDDALARWKEYAAHVQAKPESKGFHGTAVEREKRLNEWKQVNADALAVKERIEKRLKETEESMRKSSK